MREEFFQLHSTFVERWLFEAKIYKDFKYQSVTIETFFKLTFVKFAFSAPLSRNTFPACKSSESISFHAT